MAKLVLIVDDDPDVRELLAMCLSRAGYTVNTACDGAEAIELLERGELPCAILTDLVMPKVVGQELLAYLQGMPRFERVAVAIVSGNPELAPPGVVVFRKPARLAPILAFVAQAATA